MKRTTAALALTLLASPAMSGCAYVLHGTRQRVRMESNPPGCRVVVDGYDAGVTPCEIELERQSAHVVAFKHAGYEDKTATVNQEFAAVTFFDVCLPPPLLWALLDVLTGASYDLYPTELYVTLDPAWQPMPPPPPPPAPPGAATTPANPWFTPTPTPEPTR